MELEEYLNHFKLIFHKDVGFSRKFTSQVNNIIRKNFAKILDHERHDTDEDKQKDLAGIDRTIHIPKMDIPIGVRIRREYALDWCEYTVDLKEYSNKNQPSYYFIGFADKKSSIPNSKEANLRLWVLFNYRKFIELAKSGILKPKLCKNKRHSTVYFYAFSLKQICTKCPIIDISGEKDFIRNIMDENQYVIIKQQRKL